MSEKLALENFMVSEIFRVQPAIINFYFITSKFWCIDDSVLEPCFLNFFFFSGGVFKILMDLSSH